ncbi:heavy metal-binding domain-containing protein [Iningainema tapete]|uniref:Heavy metal-binding domain-containing protein n=1 Tax=Iningainema tapete BLCC-T55 TaxID=2748662 RepID=A0A8J6XE44_9CYAN|nr:heavy metal-binding domain-containing protein [Iningainema tapete]MBD2773754.1 heavy metal-binding domain-containing protein [Iningainema tapete BLCC-T55]
MNNPQQQMGIPEHARTRLQAMRGGNGKQSLFTSDLSVNEFLLVKEAGFDPLGLVLGCSMYHIGFQAAAWNQNVEMTVLSEAMYNARELAMSRMEAEALALGADGIVGVRLTARHMPWEPNLAEFVAIGTAVVARDCAERSGKAERTTSYRTNKGKPFTSDLSGQDFWTMLNAGYRPVGLVLGNCVYHVAYQGLRQWFNNIGKNVEMTNFTQALYEARELAMERMQVEAAHLGAEGIIGARIHEGQYSWSSHVIEFFALGTAVVPTRSDHHIPKPQLILSLNDPPLENTVFSTPNSHTSEH